MPDWIKKPLTTLAFCWRLQRRDGVTIGLTSHDRDIALGGLTYRATPGMAPSAIERTSGFDADSVELKGALSSDAIRAEDLLAGRWDGAQLRLFAVDWSDPETNPVHLARGELGNVSVSGDAFSVELRGPTAVLDAPVSIETSPDCRASLGDNQCRVDMAGRSRIVTVSASTGSRMTVSAVLVSGDYVQGDLRWLDGANAGLKSLILANDAGHVELATYPPFPVISGARVSLTQGCDLRFATCVSRFANAANFRGEPHLPGNDLLLRNAA